MNLNFRSLLLVLLPVFVNAGEPNIKVDDIEAEHQRVKKLGPRVVQDPIVDLGVTKIFMFQDPDGNVIEFFSLK